MILPFKNQTKRNLITGEPFFENGREYDSNGVTLKLEIPVENQELDQG
jgi:hypothetical protein